MNSLEYLLDHAGHTEAESPAQSKHANRIDTLRQAHQNITALRQPLTSPCQQQPSKVAENEGSIGGVSSPRQKESIQELGKRMDELRQERSRYAETISALETQICESEAACGRMLQRYLELGRAITLREKQIQDDKENLRRVQHVKEDKGRELDVVLTKISNLVSGAENVP